MQGNLVVTFNDLHFIYNYSHFLLGISDPILTIFFTLLLYLLPLNENNIPYMCRNILKRLNKISLSSAGYCNSLNVFFVLLASTGGGIIYIILRASEPVFFNWIRFVGLGNLLELTRQSTLKWSMYVPDWMIYSLPGGLWSFGYTLIIIHIWKGSDSWLKYLWIISIPVLVLGFELLQFAGIVPGTFCFEDLMLNLFGIVFGIYLGKKPAKFFRYEKAFQ